MFCIHSYMEIQLLCLVKIENVRIEGKRLYNESENINLDTRWEKVQHKRHNITKCYNMHEKQVSWLFPNNVAI